MIPINIAECYVYTALPYSESIDLPHLLKRYMKRSDNHQYNLMDSADDIFTIAPVPYFSKNGVQYLEMKNILSNSWNFFCLTRKMLDATEILINDKLQGILAE